MGVHRRNRRPSRSTIGVTLLATALLAAVPITGASAGEDGSFLGVEVTNDYVQLIDFTGTITVSFEKGGTEVCSDWVTTESGNPPGCDITRGTIVTATDGIRTAQVVAERLKVVKSNSVSNIVVVKIPTTIGMYTYGCGGDANFSVAGVMRYLELGKNVFDLDEPGPCPGPEDDGTADILPPSSIREGDEIFVSLHDADGDRTGLPAGVQAGRPTVPRKVKIPANSVTDKKFKLQWNAPNRDGDAPIVGYEINYKVQGGDWTVVHVSGDEFSLVIRDLQADTKYLAKVRAINEHGKLGKFSEAVSVFTNP